MKLPNKKLLLLIILAALLPLAQKVYAQNERTFTVVPPSIQVNLNPGQRSEGVMKVINDSDSTLYFTASVQDFVVNDAVGTPTLLPPNTLSNKYSAASWIGITPETFSVAPHQQQLLNYYIQVPDSGRPGGHYAAVIYTPVASGSLQGSGASVNTEVGSLFYIGVNGNIKQDAGVSRFFAKGFQEYGPVNIMTQIQNNGDLHIKPSGAIDVFDMLGRKIETVGLAQNNIFPGGVVRDYQNQVGTTLMIGRYKATLLASYGTNNNLPLSSTLYFWVFPWKLTLLLILIIIAIVLGAMYVRKRKRMTKDQPKTTTPTPSAPQEPTKA